LDGRCRGGSGSLISGAGGESGIFTGADWARSGLGVSTWTTSTSQSTQSCVAVRCGTSWVTEFGHGGRLSGSRTQSENKGGGSQLTCLGLAKAASSVAANPWGRGRDGEEVRGPAGVGADPSYEGQGSGSSASMVRCTKAGATTPWEGSSNRIVVVALRRGERCVPPTRAGCRFTPHPPPAPARATTRSCAGPSSPDIARI
jgi:hypothetical protein